MSEDASNRCQAYRRLAHSDDLDQRLLGALGLPDWECQKKVTTKLGPRVKYQCHSLRIYTNFSTLGGWVTLYNLDKKIYIYVYIVI